MSFAEEQQVTVLYEAVTFTRRKFLAEFKNVDESHLDKITIEGFLEYIERQRLTHMPHRGSHWDKVLKWAEFFAFQISGYADAVGPFVSNSKTAAQLIWTASESLLDVSLLQVLPIRKVHLLTRPSSVRIMPKLSKLHSGSSTALDSRYRCSCKTVCFCPLTAMFVAK